ncbi:MAG: ATP-dependent protease LonB, partial [DPANN group archaeon]|nr:ATP-dependent protease LonB [DPANN group archaeon]
AMSGLVLPIEAEVTVASGKPRDISATGKLGQIAKEAVTNVSAVIKKLFAEDIKKYDVYAQFLQTYEGVEGDSASIAVAVAVISALKNIPVKQEIAMTGSLSIRGEVLPVGGVTQKVEAAIEAGLQRVLVPQSNLKDVILANGKAKIELVPVRDIVQVLEHALDWKGNEEVLAQLRRKK